MRVIYLFACIVLWGFTYFLEKMAVDRLSAWWVQTYYGLIVGFTSVFLLFFLGIKSDGIVFDKRAVIFLIFSATTAIAGNILFFLSIKDNPNSGAYIIASNAYVVVVLILSAIFLSENITLIKFVAMLFICLGNVLLILSK